MFQKAGKLEKSCYYLSKCTSNEREGNTNLTTMGSWRRTSLQYLREIPTLKSSSKVFLFKMRKSRISFTISLHFFIFYKISIAKSAHSNSLFAHLSFAIFCASDRSVGNSCVICLFVAFGGHRAIGKAF